MNIILGSASKSRKRVLERAGFDFKVMTADIDEKAIRFNDPKELVLALANAKADAIFPQIKEPSILITADQVVFCNEKIREKPESEEEAWEFLKSYAHYPAECISGIAITNTGTGKRISKIDISTIYFKPIPDFVIAQLIKEENIFRQSGGFSAEDPLLAPYVDSIDGSLDSIEGLPMELIKQMIQEIKN